MSKFKSGDRVATYSDRGRETGTVTFIEGEYVHVRLDGKHYHETCHSRQCRKLKPKAPPREFWVNVYPNGAIYASRTEKEGKDIAIKYGTECIHVREVRGKTK